MRQLGAPVPNGLSGVHGACPKVTALTDIDTVISEQHHDPRRQCLTLQRREVEGDGLAIILILPK
jgi:hypothetical protein